MNQRKTGLALGTFAAFVHVVWVFLVALGWAEPWINFVYRMHFINNTFTIMSFDLGRGIGVIVIAFIMGNIVGNIFAFVWNKIHK